MHRIDTINRVQDLFGTGKDGFRDGDKANSISPTDFSAAWCNEVQETIATLVEAAGITLLKGDYNQLVDALVVKGLLGNYFTAADAGGTADAITADFPVDPLALVHGMTFHVRATAANGTTTPTFTPNAGTVPPTTIVKGNNLALALGDIAGAGHRICVSYDAPLDKWVLQNPATGISPAQSKQIHSMSASVAANALTLNYNGGTLDFRNATLSNGAPNSGVVVAANSITIPSGATLGTGSGQQARIVLLEAYNGGSPVACVVNLAGGVKLDETTLISPTTISAGATSASTIYSASAVSANSPFRVVGFVDVTEATAGTWATAPSTVQGSGGQALAAMSSLGYGQTWQDMSGSRALNTTYYNTTGKPIFVFIETGTATLTITVNGVVATKQAITTGSNAAGGTIVPPGGSYIATGNSINTWAELR